MGRQCVRLRVLRGISMIHWNPANGALEDTNVKRPRAWPPFNDDDAHPRARALGPGPPSLALQRVEPPTPGTPPAWASQSGPRREEIHVWSSMLRPRVELTRAWVG